MNKKVFTVLVFVLVGLFGQAVYGCSCVISEKKQKIDYQKWLKGFDGAAFTGRVVKVETNEEKLESKVTFAVRTYWRGVEGTEAVVYTPSDSGMCGLDYEIGKDYTVFADRSDSRLRTYLCSEMTYSSYREGFLKVLGAAKRPSVSAGNPPRKIDEFGDINCEDELARLDSFANELQNDPASVGYVIIYGGKKGKRNEARARLARMTYYLTESRRLDPESFNAVDGGFRETLMGELWIAKPGDSTPEATPTVGKKDVRFKGKAKVRGYNCGNEMGN
jgi:hypothetical protein